MINKIDRGIKSIIWSLDIEKKIESKQLFGTVKHEKLLWCVCVFLFVTRKIRGNPKQKLQK